MRKTLLGSALCACLLLVVATCWLLLTPVSALAAQGTAKCAGGADVACTAQSCICMDNIGCDACNQQSNGSWSCERTACKKGDEWLD